MRAPKRQRTAAVQDLADLLLWPALELSLESCKMPPCRFTNSIAVSAVRTAKCWCARRSGKERPARIAARRNSPKNSRYSLPAEAAEVRTLPARATPARAAFAGPADHIRTDGMEPRRHRDTEKAEPKKDAHSVPLCLCASVVKFLRLSSTGQHHCFRGQGPQIPHQPIRLVRFEFLVSRTASRHCQHSCANRAAAADVQRSVPNHHHFIIA